MSVVDIIVNNSETQASEQDVEKAKDTVEASKEVPAPETQKIASNPFEASKEETKEEKIEKINASDMSLAEKLRAITKVRYGK